MVSLPPVPMSHPEPSCALELHSLYPPRPPRACAWWLRYTGRRCRRGDAVRVRELRVDGVQPDQVLHIDVSLQDRLLFSLDSVQDRGGRVSTAGQMLQAMARYGGRHGLSIAAAELGSPPSLAGLVVRLQLQADEGAAPQWVSVQARTA